MCLKLTRMPCGAVEILRSSRRPIIVDGPLWAKIAGIIAVNRADAHHAPFRTISAFPKTR